MANEPITREEMLLNAVATGEAASFDPITREEMFLAKLGGADVNTPTPITRKEQFLQKAIENAGSGGSGGGSGGGAGGIIIKSGSYTSASEVYKVDIDTQISTTATVLFVVAVLRDYANATLTSTGTLLYGAVIHDVNGLGNYARLYGYKGSGSSNVIAQSYTSANGAPKNNPDIGLLTSSDTYWIRIGSSQAFATIGAGNTYDWYIGVVE